MELVIVAGKLQPFCTYRTRTPFSCKQAITFNGCFMDYKQGELSELYFSLIKKCTLDKAFIDRPFNVSEAESE